MSGVIIAHRFRGPPRSGNGGYTCGLAAGLIDGSAASVSLRAPPPLDTPLAIAREDERVKLIDPAGAVVVEATPAEIDLDVPAPPLPEAIDEAMARYTGARAHVFPECFVCGPRRAEGDGLRIFAGPVEGRPGMVAARWIPDPSLAETESDSGAIAGAHLWAALDCPGYFASALREGPRPGVLARLSARIDARPSPNEPLTCLGWSIGSEGKKHRVGTAVLRDGEVLARAEGLWIELDPAALARFT